MKKYYSIFPILIICFIVSISGCTDNDGNNSTKTINAPVKYFQVDGNLTDLNDCGFKIPVHKTVNERIYFYYTPYKDNIPEIGGYCMVPQNIDTTKTFMLEIFEPNMTKYNAIDIYVKTNESGPVVQTEHIILK